MNLRPRMLTTTDEMEAIINEAQVCYVGMSDNNTPYVLPMNFAYADGVIFLHSAQEGQKIDVLKSNPLVSINFNTGNELFHRHKEVGCSWGMKFRSVIVSGRARFIEDYTEKYRIMQLVMEKYAGEKFEFAEPSIKNVAVIRIEVERMTGKVYGEERLELL